MLKSPVGSMAFSTTIATKKKRSQYCKLAHAHSSRFNIINKDVNITVIMYF